MDLPANRFKRALLAGREQIGLWVLLASPYCAEVVAGRLRLAADRHRALAQRSRQRACAVAGGRRASATAVVRPHGRQVLIQPHLDIGAENFLDSYVQTAEEAQAAVAAMRYPLRACAGWRERRAPRASPASRSTWRMPNRLCLLVQVESGCARPGGDRAPGRRRWRLHRPGRLERRPGFLGEQTHPEVVAAIEDAIRRIKAAARRRHSRVDEKAAKRYIEAGTLFTAVGNDVMLLAREMARLAAAVHRNSDRGRPEGRPLRHPTREEAAGVAAHLPEAATRHPR